MHVFRVRYSFACFNLDLIALMISSICSEDIARDLSDNYPRDQT